MRALHPEILAEVQGLSLPLLIGGYLAGLLLWSLGWWSHRFWSVLVATVMAGVYGLYAAPGWGLPPAVGALSFAVATGMLALSVMRFVAFAAGGVACVGLMQILAPSVDAPLICLLSGGVMAILLYRPWVMVLTSMAGSVVSGYALLGLLGRFTKMNVVEWTGKHDVLLNWICLGLTALGCFTQYYLSKPRAGGGDSGDESGEDGGDDEGSEGPGKKWLWFPNPFRKAA